MCPDMETPRHPVFMFQMCNCPTTIAATTTTTTMYYPFESSQLVKWFCCFIVICFISGKLVCQKVNRPFSFFCISTVVHCCYFSINFYTNCSLYQNVYLKDVLFFNVLCILFLSVVRAINEILISHRLIKTESLVFMLKKFLIKICMQHN